MGIKAGIIILNYNSYKHTIKCVKSVIEKSDICQNMIYIVDNASPDGSFQKLKDKYDGLGNIQILKAKRNGGYSYGNNIGIKKAVHDGAEYIFIVNPDTCLLNDAVSYMIRALDENPDAGAVGPRLVQPDGKGQFARTYYTFPKAVFSKKPFSFLRLKDKKFNRDLEWCGQEQFQFEGMVAGCFFALRAEDFCRIGMFDEDFFLYNEEDVIAYKLKTIGKKSMVIPEAAVYHEHAAATKKKGWAFIYYHYRVSEFLLLCKYAKIGAGQRACIFLMNMTWFVLFSVKEKEARKYLCRMFRVYRSICKGEYERVNEALLPVSRKNI